MSKIDNMTEKQPPSYPLRMPSELREQLAEAAKASGRSMNAEIVTRLQSSFSMPDLSGSTLSIDDHGEPLRKDIAQSIADLQDAVNKASWLANSLTLFEGVRAERARRDEHSSQDVY